ncbi:MAG: hypothetical protein AB2A00_02115 [Myxococcota bacterium]
MVEAPGVLALWIGTLVVAGAVTQDASVAVFPLRAEAELKESVARLLTESLVEQVRKSGRFSRVVTPQEIAATMPAQQQTVIMECARSECGMVDTELAGALGATHVLVGTAGRLGSTYVLALRLLELRSALVVASVTENVSGSGDEVLLRALPRMVSHLLGQAGLMQTHVVTSPESTRPPLRPALWSVGAVTGLGAVAGLVLAGGLGVAGVGWMWLTYSVTPRFARLLPVGPLEDDTALLARLVGPASILFVLGAGVAVLGLVLGGVAVGTVAAGLGME